MSSLILLPVLFGCGAESALLQSQIDNLSEDIDVLTTTSAETESSVTALATRVDTLEQTTVPDLIEAAVSALEESIAAEITRLDDAFLQLEDRVATAEAATVPPGTIVAFAGKDVPDGWLPCDGSAVRRDEHEALHNAIGEVWGDGDGSTTFNVPDLRGQFLRGADTSAVRDPDASSRTASADGGSDEGVGTVQDDATVAHTHSVSGSSDSYSHDHGGATGGAYPSVLERFAGYYDNGAAWTAHGYFAEFRWESSGTHSHSIASDSHSHSMTGTAASTGGNETRPTNAAVLYIIKT